MPPQHVLGNSRRMSSHHAAIFAASCAKRKRGRTHTTDTFDLDSPSRPLLRAVARTDTTSTVNPKSRCRTSAADAAGPSADQAEARDPERT
jgi:hypothetical protein